MPQEEDIYTTQQRSMKNEDNIRALNVSLNALADKTKLDIDNLDNAIDDDNRQRDRSISEINNNLALLKLFVIEKLSDHPNDYVNFINHLANDSDANSVMSDTASDISTPAASSYASSVMSDTASDISTPAASSYASSVASDDSFTGGRRKKRKRTRKKKKHKSKKKSRRRYK